VYRDFRFERQRIWPVYLLGGVIAAGAPARTGTILHSAHIVEIGSILRLGQTVGMGLIFSWGHSMSSNSRLQIFPLQIDLACEQTVVGIPVHCRAGPPGGVGVRLKQNH